MKILVLGLGTNGGGASAALHFAHQNDEVRVSDTAPRSAFSTMPERLEKLGVTCHFDAKDPRDDIKWADVVIKNPAVPTSLPQLSLAKRIANDFSYLFSMEGLDKVRKVAVTGTKGKTTTVAAIQHALSELGYDVLICGNIGISAFTVIEEIERRKAEGRKMPDYIVMELSSWQIHDTYIALNGQMPRLDLAIFTSMYADHQNSYHNLREYYDDKLRLFGPQCRHILVNEPNRKFLAEHINVPKRTIVSFPGYKNPFREKKIELQCAYSALRVLGVGKKEAEKALSSYKGMPHRTEQVALFKDIMFVNDSAATIAEAVSYSMNTLSPLQTHLICGGTDKNLGCGGMETALIEASSITLLDGSFTRAKLIPFLDGRGLKYNGPFQSMKEAFNVAVAEAEKKRDSFHQVQCLLLSPGAASFEYFRNEFDRGNQFKALVKLYVARESGQTTFKL